VRLVRAAFNWGAIMPHASGNGKPSERRQPRVFR
jgi:hypothetical protein